MSSLHFLTIFCLNKTDEADAIMRVGQPKSLKVQGGSEYKDAIRSIATEAFGCVYLTVYEEIIFWYILTRSYRGSPVVPQMKDPSLNTEPRNPIDKPLYMKLVYNQIKRKAQIY